MVDSRTASLAAIFACAALLASPAASANITHKNIDGFEIIAIEGDITSGDEEKFRTLSLTYENAIVALASDGGQIVPAIEIGKLIRMRGFPTVVLQDSECVSACALIWVAGSKRFIAGNGKVGFHASYLDEGGKRQETGVGNALVGHYLSLLNLPEKAVIFATSAPPTQIRWLTKSNMAESGIDFQSIDIAQNSPPPLVRTPVASSRSAVGAEWWFVGLTGNAPDRAIYLIDKRRLGPGPNIGAWTYSLYERSNSDRRKSTKRLVKYDCSARSSALVQLTDYDSAGNVIGTYDWKPYEQKPRVVVPESIGEGELNFVCGEPEGDEFQLEVTPEVFAARVFAQE